MSSLSFLYRVDLIAFTPTVIIKKKVIFISHDLDLITIYTQQCTTVKRKIFR